MRITPLPEFQSEAPLPATGFARIDGLLQQQARLVGLAGPSGGGVPQAGRLVLAGDETAYPAMARIVQMRPEARAEVWLRGRSADCPLPARAGLRLRHLPGGGASLAAILRENPPAPKA